MIEYIFFFQWKNEECFFFLKKNIEKNVVNFLNEKKNSFSFFFQKKTRNILFAFFFPSIRIQQRKKESRI